jgi:PST family polysaccharide transporter
MWRELIGFGRHVMTAEFVRRVAAELDAALVGRFIGTAPLGQYRYARRFALQPLAAIVNVTSYVLLPALARLAGEEGRFRLALLRGLRWTSIAAMPASLVLLPLGEPLAVLLLGEEWRQAGQALAALCLYSAGGAIVSVASEAFKAWGSPEVLLRVHLLAAGLLTVLMLAFLPFGLIAVATAVSLASAGAGLYALLSVGRTVGIPFRRLAREVWPALVAAGVAAGALYPLERWAVRAGERGTAAGLGLVAAEVLAGALCYLALLAALAPATARELAVAARIASRA